MSDIGKLRRPGSSPFPTFRKSPDPFQPEMGEMDLAQDMVHFDDQVRNSVRETEKTEHHAINDENRRKQYRRQPKKEPKQTARPTENTEMFVDVQA